MDLGQKAKDLTISIQEHMAKDPTRSLSILGSP